MKKDDVIKNNILIYKKLLEKQLDNKKKYINDIENSKNSSEKENKIIDTILDSIIDDNIYLEMLNDDNYYEEFPLLNMYFELKLEHINSFYNAIKENKVDNYKFEMESINTFIINAFQDSMSYN